MKHFNKIVTKTTVGQFAWAALTLSAAGFAALKPGLALAEETNPIAESRSAPELLGKAWLNADKGKAPKLADRKGKVTLVHFWTLACINCKHNLPAYNRLQKKYAERDVQIIGVHTPETPGESRFAAVRASIKRWGITYPVLVDNDNTNWNRWHQQFWPTLYLLDRTGKIRYRWEGELAFDGQSGETVIGEKIESLLKEK